MPDDVYQIDCSRGGFTHNPNIDAIPPWMMVEPSRNINMHEGGRQPRGGTTKHISAGYGGARIMDQFDYRLNNGSQFLVTMTADGKIWKDENTTLKTGLSADKVPSFVVLNDLLYIANGAEIPQTWDGSAASTSDLTNPHADWATLGYPFQLIVHGRGNSERMWAIIAEKVYASAINDGTEADFTTGALGFLIGRGTDKLVGGVRFGDRLFVFSRRQFYRINDDSVDTADWGYAKTQWIGGAGNFRLAIETPYDLICFTDDGDVYSAVTAEQYGDYKIASIANVINPDTGNHAKDSPYIGRWLKEKARLEYISEFHGIYNPVLRCIDFFYVEKTQTAVSKALRYFIDRPPQEAWMPMDNQSFASGFNASCSTLVEENIGDWQIYTGDASGNVWKMEQSSKSDDGNGYYAGYKKPWTSFENSRIHKRFKRGWKITQPKGNYNLNISTWVDGENISNELLSLSGTGDVFDTGVFDTAVFGGQELLNATYLISGIGRRIQDEIYRTNAGQDFFISSEQYDFKFLGARTTQI